MTEGLTDWPEELPTPLVGREHDYQTHAQEQLMDSARVRRRRSLLEPLQYIAVTWNFTKDQFERFKEFVADDLTNYELSFLLITFEDSPTAPGEIAEFHRNVAFMSPYRWVRSDNLFSVSAVLDVIEEEVFDALPDIVFGYFQDEGIDGLTPVDSACRENASVLMTGLIEGEVYLLVTSPSIEGPWTPYIYFALLTDDEKATGAKKVHMNNDFEGATYFRVKRWKDALGATVDKFMTKAAAPLPSLIATPDVSVDNLSEITTQEQLDAIAGLGGSITGLRALEFYSADGYVTPYSSIEDPLSFPSPIYRKMTKLYGWRQWTLNSVGTLLAPTSANNVVSVTGPVGATIKWTRDGSDPTINTPAPLPYNGVANNAYVSDHLFSGIIKARCFLGGCRSPLVIIGVTKIMFERPVFKTTGMSHDSASYCDLPHPVDGSESGQSCNIVYGGVCGFEAANYASGATGGSLAASSAAGINGPLLQSRSKDIYDSSYLGWPIHGSHSGYYQFVQSFWADRSWFNGWWVAPRSHNWAITDLSPAVILVPNDMTLAGPEPSGDREAWEGIRDLQILNRLPIPPTPVCGLDLVYAMYMDRFDITRSPLPYDDARALRWDDPVFTPPPAVEEPPGESEVTVPYDPFTIYADGDAAVQVLNFHDGTDWVGAWVVLAGVTSLIAGYDKFDDYTDGAVPDYTATPSLDYIPYDGGELWELLDEWRRRDGEAKTYIESWNGIADGVLPFDEKTAGTGFLTDLGEGWVYGGTLAQNGIESWDGYADGAYVADDTGTNFVLGENWVARDMTVWYVRILQQGITNPSGSNIGVTEFEVRETVGGTNWAAAANGGVAAASSQFSAAFAPSFAIDGDSTGASNGWANNGTGGNGVSYLQVKFAAPRSVGEYKVGHYPVSGPYPALSAWDLQYSYDGTIWMASLQSVTGQTVWTFGQMKTFTIP